MILKVGKSLLAVALELFADDEVTARKACTKGHPSFGTETLRLEIESMSFSLPYNNFFKSKVGLSSNTDLSVFAVIIEVICASTCSTSKRASTYEFNSCITIIINGDLEVKLIMRLSEVRMECRVSFCTLSA